MKAIITVIGHDTIGILATVSSLCAKYGANINDVTQTVMDSYFTMIMLVNIEALTVSFTEFSDALTGEGKKKNLDVRVMHEDIFNTMHHI